jgi:hypothetical protein
MISLADHSWSLGRRSRSSSGRASRDSEIHIGHLVSRAHNSTEPTRRLPNGVFDGIVALETRTWMLGSGSDVHLGQSSHIEAEFRLFQQLFRAGSTASP